MHWRRKWQPTPVVLPGESQGWKSLVGCRLWGPTVRHDWSDLAAAAAAFNRKVSKFSTGPEHMKVTWILFNWQVTGTIINLFEGLTYLSPSNRLTFIGFPTWLSGKESPCQCRRGRRLRFNPRVRKIHWRRKWHSTPVFLPGKSHGQRSLVGYSPWGYKESDMTKYTSIY